ncbi:hypothetical protein NUSPORA_02052 [Nucleospora cyclopteri]
MHTDNGLKDKLHQVMNKILLEPNQVQNAEELLELIQQRERENSEITKEINIYIWKYPGMQIYFIQTILENYKNIYTSQVHEELLEIILKILAILVQNDEVTKNFLKMKFDTFLQPYFILQNEKIKIAALDIYCTLVFKVSTISQVSINFADVLPVALQVISSHEIQLKVKGTHLLFLVIQDNKGLDYAVQTVDRFNAIDIVVSNLIVYCVKAKHILLLKNVFKIYLRLCEKPNVKKKIIKENMPDGLFSTDLLNVLKTDFEVHELYENLCQNLSL